MGFLPDGRPAVNVSRLEPQLSAGGWGFFQLQPGYTLRTECGNYKPERKFCQDGTGDTISIPNSTPKARLQGFSALKFSGLSFRFFPTE